MSTRLKRAWVAALLLIGAAQAEAAAQDPTAHKSTTPLRVAHARAGSAFRLASLVFANGNQIECGVTDLGEMCASGNANSASGLWPKSSDDPFVYSAGIRVMGLTPMAPDCDPATKREKRTPVCFAWSGDTTAAFFDNGAHSARIIGVYDSRVAGDLAAWPAAGAIPDFPSVSALITDTTVFNSTYLGRRTASDQDTWVAYWDGDTIKSSGRTHPMGIMVEQRTMQWNQPEQNTATIYYVQRLTNVTGNPLFQKLSERKYFGGKDSLPDGGWRYDSVYVTLAVDPDVTDNSGANYYTFIAPFSMGVAYESSLKDPNFSFPPQYYHPPFQANATGLAGIKLLRSPAPATQQQITPASFTQYTGSSAFPQPFNPRNAWRYAAERLDRTKGDPSCNVTLQQPHPAHVCFLLQIPADARGSLSTGPFSMAAGESRTIVFGIMAAATVTTPLVVPGTDVKPGVPSPAPGCGTDPLRPIEIAAGWVATTVCPASAGTYIDERNVTTVHESLLNRAATAQAFVDHKFAMPRAPVSPVFYVVPGDNKTTIVWDASTTETVGDAYYQWTSDSASGLYDQNYRKFDVEGYRIYRGTSPTNRKLIAQFDKNTSVFVDALCMTDPGHETGAPCTTTASKPIKGSLIQYRSVVRGINGGLLIFDADTAGNNAIQNATGTPLTDTGIPFAYIDSTVLSGFTYYYAVTAFDVNSARTGVSSLESPKLPEAARPRATSEALNAPSIDTGLKGRNGFLAPATPATIDPVKGTFSGPQPHTTALQSTLEVYAAQILPRGAHDVRIDSVVPAQYSNGTIATYYLTAEGSATTTTFTNRTVNATSPSVPAASTEVISLPPLILRSDDSARAALAARNVDAPDLAGALHVALSVTSPLLNSLHADWAFKQPTFWTNDPPTSTWTGGSRWFSGANETMSEPAYGLEAHGQLPGVTTIFQPTPYRAVVSPANQTLSVAPAMAPYRAPTGTLLNELVFRRFLTGVLGVTRAADVRFYWGGTPTPSGAPQLDSVIDVTHDVAVKFSTAVRATYGFLPDADGDGKLTYGDFYYLEGLPATTEIAALASQKKQLLPQPLIMSVDVNGDLIADGTGFGLYVNGEPYIFQVTSSPVSSVWTLRTYNGTVARDSEGIYTFAPSAGSAAVPGLRLSNTVNAAATIVAADADLAKVHTVPDPYYAFSMFDRSATSRELQFVNLPPRADVRIYSLTGVLVSVIIHDDATGGGKATWDLRTRNGGFAASGVYLFHVVTPEGRTAVGKFTVIGPPNK